MLKTINANTIRRSFEMTIGLSEGYKGKRMRDMEEVEKIILGWLSKQQAAGRPYIPGKLDYNTILYTHHGKKSIEPVAIYRGELSPLYNSELPDALAIKALIGLATLIAEKLRQTRIYLTYRDQILILEDPARKAEH
jgi:hypothetical protein